jgi:hypothetical protein
MFLRPNFLCQSLRPNVLCRPARARRAHTWWRRYDWLDPTARHVSSHCRPSEPFVSILAAAAAPPLRLPRRFLAPPATSHPPQVLHPLRAQSLPPRACLPLSPRIGRKSPRNPPRGADFWLGFSPPFLCPGVAIPCRWACFS